MRARCNYLITRLTLMPKLFFFLIFFLIGVNYCYSTIITVDNKVPSMGQFTNLQDAHDFAANDGTAIIYIYPSPIPYQAITVSKHLTISGNGFETPVPSFYTSKIIGEFNVTSDGVKITSLDGQFSVRIAASHVRIQRNNLSNIIIQPGFHNNEIVQNKINFASANGYSIIIEDNQAVTISNNIIIHYMADNGSDSKPVCIYMKHSDGSIVSNYIATNFYIHSGWENCIGGYAFYLDNCGD